MRRSAFSRVPSSERLLRGDVNRAPREHPWADAGEALPLADADRREVVGTDHAVAVEVVEQAVRAGTRPGLRRGLAHFVPDRRQIAAPNRPVAVDVAVQDVETECEVAAGAAVAARQRAAE